MKITFISDTHNKHKKLNLVDGDMIIHSGDISSMGYNHEIKNFLKWFNSVNYKYKIFIAGNHDWGFQLHPNEIKNILKEYPDIIYLQDNSVIINDIKIYGSPWQPKFLNWAFNLQRNSKDLKEKWDKIPEDTDILITHIPPNGYLDNIGDKHLGCELLTKRIEKIKPKIHAYGHIHSENGYIYDGYTHFINSSILDNRYIYRYKPFTIDKWNKNTKKIF